MSSSAASAFEVFANYVLHGLRLDVIQHGKYAAVFDAVGDSLSYLCTRYYFGRDLGPLYVGMDPDLFPAILTVSRELAPLRVGGTEAPIRTWADYASVLLDALTANNLVAENDRTAFLAIVMFVKDLSLELDADITHINVRKPRLTRKFVKFMLSIAAQASQRAATVRELHPEKMIKGIEVPEVVVAEPEPEPEVVVAEPEPEPEVVVAEPEPPVDADGDVVMETEEMASEGRGSKRRRSEVLTYETERARVTETKRRYNLRDTRAREERMTNLKEAEDSKRKADEPESSSKGSRKRSRK